MLVSSCRISISYQTDKKVIKYMKYSEKIEIDHSKNDGGIRFYRDPLQKVDFILSKTVLRLVF